MYTVFGMEHWANEAEIMKWYMRKNRAELVNNIILAAHFFLQAF